MTTADDTGSNPQLAATPMRRVAASVLIGTTIEWYDFILYRVLVGVGLFIRLRIADTPVFEQVRRSGRTARMPLADALRRYPRQITLATGSMISTGAYFYIVNTYALSYSDSSATQSGNAMLVAVLVSALVAVAALPYFGGLAQRRGRRTMIVIGLAAMAVWIFPTVAAINSGNPVVLVLAYVVGAVLFSVSYGSQATFITELFDATVRFSASTVSFQLGVLLGGAIAPLVATALVASTGTSLSVAGYVAALSLLSLACVLMVSQRDLTSGSADMNREAAA